MTTEFITYEQALALKELGFDEPCFGLYHTDKTFYPTQCKSHEQFHGQVCSAPLYQQAFRWFREKHNLLVSPFQSMNDITDEVKDYYFEIGKVGNLNVIVSTDNFQIYEEAEHACLIKLIEIVKTK